MHRGLLTTLLTAGAVVLAACGGSSANAHVRPARSDGVNPSHDPGQAARWPRPMCAVDKGGVVTDTTTGFDDYIRAEPPGTQLHPRMTAVEAYAAYVNETQGPTRAQAPQMQVRFGYLTDTETGMASRNALGIVPALSHVPAWLVSICDAPVATNVLKSVHVPVPPASHHGTLIAIVDDSTGHVVAGNYQVDKMTIGLGHVGGYESPSYRETSYLSTPWTLVRQEGQRVLVRYTAVRCHTLDHIHVTQGLQQPPQLVVILRGGTERSLSY